MFAMIVPLLLGFATLLFAYSERISGWLRARAEGRGHTIAFDFASLEVVLPVSFYGGYFGAGVGILMLGVFSLATGQCRQEFRLESQRIRCHPRFRNAGCCAMAANPGSRRRNDRWRIDRRLCSAGYSAERRARAGRRCRRGAHHRICAALLVLGSNPIARYCLRCTPAQRGVPSLRCLDGREGL